MEENKNDRCCISSDQLSSYQFLVKVIFQKRVRDSVSLSFPTREKRWKHETAGRAVLLFEFRVIEAIKLLLDYQAGVIVLSS